MIFTVFWKYYIYAFLIIGGISSNNIVHGIDHTVHNELELQDALTIVQPGDQILLNLTEGVDTIFKGHFVLNTNGTKDQPIVLSVLRGSIIFAPPFSGPTILLAANHWMIRGPMKFQCGAQASLSITGSHNDLLDLHLDGADPNTGYIYPYPITVEGNANKFSRIIIYSYINLIYFHINGGSHNIISEFTFYSEIINFYSMRLNNGNYNVLSNSVLERSLSMTGDSSHNTIHNVTFTNKGINMGSIFIGGPTEAGPGNTNNTISNCSFNYHKTNEITYAIHLGDDRYAENSGTIVGNKFGGPEFNATSNFFVSIASSGWIIEDNDGYTLDGLGYWIQWPAIFATFRNNRMTLGNPENLCIFGAKSIHSEGTCITADNTCSGGRLTNLDLQLNDCSKTTDSGSTFRTTASTIKMYESTTDPEPTNEPTTTQPTPEPTNEQPTTTQPTPEPTTNNSNKLGQPLWKFCIFMNIFILTWNFK